ncbi:ABC transporter permease subunit [bacterium]|nr:ABC transporter permease subunit [bacterium]
MSKICAIWRKEFSSYWYSPIAYIVITVFLVLMNWLFFRGFFLVNNADMRMFFSIIPWAFLLLMPALTMRQWAEELRSGTIESLMTKPVHDREVVIGKYLAAVAFLAVVLVLTLTTPLTVAGLSENGLDWGMVITSYLGAFLLGSAYLAIGGWAGSFTSNQIVAFIIGVAVIFFAIMIGESLVTMFVPSFMVTPLEYLGLQRHYLSIMRGVIDTRDLIYYITVICFFLYLTVRAVESRKWS